MHGPIFQFFNQDHTRLEGLMDRAVADPERIDMEAYAAFRAGILRHIAWEEKILVRAAKEARRGEPLPMAQRLRIDHGAIALLLVPTPTHDLVHQIRSILGPHNTLEEGPAGLYEQCDEILAPQAEQILEKVRAYPEVKLAPHYDGPGVYRRAEDALRLSAKQFEPKSASGADR